MYKYFFTCIFHILITEVLNGDYCILMLLEIGFGDHRGTMRGLFLEGWGIGLDNVLLSLLTLYIKVWCIN